MRVAIALTAAAAILLTGQAEAAPPPCKPVPIEEALRIGHTFAKQWRPQVELLLLDTVHPPSEWEQSPTPPGLDGTRCVWNLEFKDPKTDEFILFRVANGIVADVKLDGGWNTAPGLPPEIFCVTGKALAEQAKQAGLLPTKPPGTAGYSYYLTGRDTGRFAVAVVGADAKGKPASIQVDPRTGKLIPPQFANPADAWESTDKVKALESALLRTLQPQIQATIAGIYGTSLLFDQARITQIQQNKLRPGILRIMVTVQPFVGAHNTAGTDTIEFIMEPQLVRVATVQHKPPEVRNH